MCISLKKQEKSKKNCAKRTDTFIPILYIFIYQMGLRPMGISHGLSKCPPDTCFPCHRQGRPFDSRTGKKEQTPPAIIYIFVYQMGLRPMGISHGLKSVHWTLFLTAFRFPWGSKKKATPSLKFPSSRWGFAPWESPTG